MITIKKAIFFGAIIFIFIIAFLTIEKTTNILPLNNRSEIETPLINEERKSDPKVTPEQQPNMNNLTNEVVPQGQSNEKEESHSFSFKKDPKPLPILLLGAEKTAEEKYGRSDSIMLAFAQPKTKELMLLSIPRDTYIHIPNHGYDKLNKSFQIGGAKLTREIISDWLDIEISDSASIDYANFEQLIDIIGGLELYVDRQMVHNEFSLEKGLQTLSGKEALHFVRFRKSIDGNHDSDYKRTERQRQVLSKLTNELLKKRSFTESFQLLHSLIKTVDTTLSLQEIIIYGQHYSDISPDNITTLSFQGVGKRRGGIWYEIISEEELKEKKKLIHEFMDK